MRPSAPCSCKHLLSAGRRMAIIFAHMHSRRHRLSAINTPTLYLLGAPFTPSLRMATTTTTTTSKYTSKLQSSRILVLGGTSGIGFCVAEAALEHGAHVTISGSKQPKLDTALSRLQSAYPDKHSRLNGQTCDLSQPQSLESNLDTLLKFAAASSKINHIVFTAGDPLKIFPSRKPRSKKSIARATCASSVRSSSLNSRPNTSRPGPSHRSR